MKIEDSVAIHQPHFLPWFPYIVRLASAETYIVFDTVNYKKYYFHNRCVFLDRNNERFNFIVPVNATISVLIKDATLDPLNFGRFLKKGLLRLEHEYHRYKFFTETYENLLQIFNLYAEGKLTTLVELNLKLILQILKLLEITPPKIEYASQIDNCIEERTNSVINLVYKSHKHNHLCGWGGSISPKVFDQQAIINSGIKIWTLDQKRLKALHPEYLQEGLSIIHWLFKYGPDKIREDIYKATECFTQLKNIKS